MTKSKGPPKVPDIGKAAQDLKNALPGMPKIKLPDMGKIKMPELGKIDLKSWIPSGQDLKNMDMKKLLQAVKNIDTDKFTREYLGKRSKGGGVLFEGDRPMKYPYTFTAKVMQFPWVYYAQKQWVFRYYLIAVVVCIPIFKYFSSLANSPENVKKWKEIRRQERMKQHH